MKQEMIKTIPVDQLPREAERMLSVAWEEHKSVVLERNGEPVAAVVPMDEYRRWNPKTAKAKGGSRKAESRSPAEPVRKPKAPAESPLAYELPADVLAEYHRLLNKKFSEGLTPVEEIELERVDKELDEADMATPLGQYINTKAEREHARRMAILDDLMAKLKDLQASR